MKEEEEEKEVVKKVVLIRRQSTSGGSVSFGDLDAICTDTEDVDLMRGRRADLTKHLQLLGAGGVAGSLGKTVTAPLSRLTILFQVHSMVSSKHSDQFATSVSQALRKVAANEGVLAFWKGNGASVVHRFPYSAVNFLTYETVKARLVAADDENENRLSTRFFSGAIAGATATTVCYPIDLIRTRLATQQDCNIRYRGISHAFHRIRAEEGIRGLYRGMGTTLGVTVPNLAINFTVYETLKEKVLAHRNTKLEDDIEFLSIKDTLGCGAFAGVLSSLTTFPIDVIRRRLQLSGIESFHMKPSVVVIAQTLYKEQGLKGFYRGLTPELLKVVPMVGITFGSFEKIKQTFDI